MSKESKAQANYVPSARRDHCSTCAHWRNGTCVLVQGPINPDGSCDLYSKAGKKK